MPGTGQLDPHLDAIREQRLVEDERRHAELVASARGLDTTALATGASLGQPWRTAADARHAAENAAQRARLEATSTGIEDLSLATGGGLQHSRQADARATFDAAVARLDELLATHHVDLALFHGPEDQVSVRLDRAGVPSEIGSAFVQLIGAADRLAQAGGEPSHRLLRG